MKIILDIVMTISMVCLLNLNITGLKLHEMLGVGICFLFLFHKILNFKWIKAMTKSLFKNNISSRAKTMYIIDTVLIVLVILTVYTGILVSKHILIGVTTTNITATIHRHHCLAYLLGVTLLIHIGLHWPFIRNAVKIKKDSIMEKIVLCVITLILGIVLLDSNAIKKLIIPKKEINYPYQVETTQDEDTQNYTLPNGEEKEELTIETDILPSDDNEEQYSQDNEASIKDIPTIEDYLSKLICTACGRHCLLTNPECGRGRREQLVEVQEYNQLYGTNETYGTGESYTRN